jgi:hypothetical protein
MATVNYNIAEHDVVAFRAQVGAWPAGTEGRPSTSTRMRL